MQRGKGNPCHCANRCRWGKAETKQLLTQRISLTLRVTEWRASPAFKMQADKIIHPITKSEFFCWNSVEHSDFQSFRRKIPDFVLAAFFLSLVAFLSFWSQQKERNEQNRFLRNWIFRFIQSERKPPQGRRLPRKIKFRYNLTAFLKKGEFFSSATYNKHTGKPLILPRRRHPKNSPGGELPKSNAGVLYYYTSWNLGRRRPSASDFYPVRPAKRGIDITHITSTIKKPKQHRQQKREWI